MTSQSTVRQHSNAYNIFILVLTILSLAIMVMLILPLSEATHNVLLVYDNFFCFIFLGDFALNMARAKRKRDYFIGQRGWLDLMGSIPTLGFFRFTALFRLARLSRLQRISILLSGQNREDLIDDVIDNRGQYAAFITLLSAMVVLVVSSILVLQFESKSPDANITTGGDALWWSVVTITTVGYGDKYPVTTLGRLTAVSVMLAGVGIIGALASILASILVPPPKPDVDDVAEAAAATAATSVTPPAPGPGTTAPTTAIEAELAALRAEIQALRLSLVSDRQAPPG
jgi:voltage-gated potassium channel